MVFYACAVCDMEAGKSELKDLKADLLKRIQASGMPALYVALTKDRDNDTVSSCDRGYANAAYNELTVDGLLKGASYVCKVCVRQLPKVKRAPRKKTTVIDNENTDEEGDSCDDAVIIVGNEVQGIENKNTFELGRNNGVPQYALVNGFFRGMFCLNLLFNVIL